MTPLSSTIPFSTTISNPSRGTHAAFANSARMRSRISSSPQICEGCSSSACATALRRSARLTIPTQELVLEYGYAFDMTALHQLDDFLNRRVLHRADEIARHDLVDLAPMASDILSCHSPRTHQDFEPAGAVSLGSGLDAAQ